MITTKKNIFFKLGVLHLVIFDENILSNCFDSVQFLLLNKLSKVDLPKSTSAKQHFELEVFVLHIWVLSKPNQHRLTHLWEVVAFTFVILFLVTFEASKGWCLALKVHSLIKIKRWIVYVCLLTSKFFVVFFLAFYFIIEKSLRVVGQVVNTGNLVFRVVCFVVCK